MGPLMTELLESTSKITDKHFQLIEICKTIFKEEQENFPENTELPSGRNILLALPIDSIDKNEEKCLVLEWTAFKTYEIFIYSKNINSTTKSLMKSSILAELHGDEKIPKIMEKYAGFLNHYRKED